MQKFQAHRRARRIIYSWPSLVILFVIMLVLAKATWGAYGKYTLARDNLADVRREHDSLEGRKETLSREIARLKTQEGVEEQIRRNFQVAKPGEDLVVVTDTPTSTLATTSAEKQPFWKSWLGDR